MTTRRLYVPDYVLAASQSALTAMLPLFERTPGSIRDTALYARYRRDLRTLIGDTRAAARNENLAQVIASIASGFRVASSDPRAVVAGLERVVVAAFAFAVTPASTGTLGKQRDNEQALLLLFESLALAEIGNAIAQFVPRSHEEASTLRLRIGRLFDLAIERASDRGAVDIQRALRTVQARVVRDLIERGRPLARVVAYETGVPLPAVVLAHRFYQDAGRADELRLENRGTDHPAFMPLAGRAYSR